MTPSNPDNQQSLIYRIADALGVFHLVAPVNHTHAQSDVEGLESALAAKANKVAAGSPSGGIVIAGTSGELARSNKTVQDLLNAIDEKNSINQVDEDDEQEAHLKAIAEDDDVYFKFQLKNGDTEKQVLLTVSKMDNFARAISNPDSAPAASSDNLVTSGGVKAAIDALLTNRIPIHQVAAILPKTSGHGSEQELQNWLGDGKMALVLQTARPVEVSIEATGVDDSPTGTWSGSTDFSFDLGQGIRTVKNIYDLMYAQLQNDYPGERIGAIENWKICVYAKDTVEKDTACLINFYNPTSAE